MGIISKKAVRIGQSLESVETERANAENAKKLIELIMNLNSPSESNKALQQLLDATASENSSMAMSSAMTVKDLVIIAAELDIDQTEKAKAAIKQLGSDVEKYLIGKFISATKSEDYTKMKETAAILFAFNGGASCMEAYLQTLNFLKEGYDPFAYATKKGKKKEDKNSASSSSHEGSSLH